MKSELEPVKDADSASCVKMTNVVKAAVEAKSALELMAEESKKFEAPFAYRDELVGRIEALMVTWEKARKGLENCADRIHRLQQDQKAALASKKKTWHEQKQKLIAYLTKHCIGITPPLAFVFAELIYQRACDPKTVGIDPPWVIPEFQCADPATKDFSTA